MTNSDTAPIRLMSVDDHALFREGIKALLLATPDIEHVGEAATGQEAIDQIASLAPDVVLMDINMPGMSGIEATRRILAQQPEVGIIMVTMLEDDASVFSAMRAGARGYVLKGAHHQEMLDSIRAVAQGQALFGAAIAARMVHFFNRPVAPQGGPFTELTEREHEILTMVARHMTNGEIAQQLGLTNKTVRNTVSTILNKLQVADRAEAIIRAREAGLDE